MPNVLYGQNEQTKNSGNVVGLNFECSISGCDFSLEGYFLEDLLSLRNDNGDLYSSLGSDIQGESVSSPLIGYPVAYTSGSTLKITLHFEGICAALTSSIMLQGVSASGLEFPALSLPVNNVNGVSNFTYEGEASSAFTADKVDFIDLEIKWQMKSAGNQEWKDVVVTKNKIYVTLKAPADEGQNNTPGEVNLEYFHLESAFFIGCKAAKGSNTEGSVIENVWSAFSSADLTNSKVETLKYYDPSNWYQAENNKTSTTLVKDLNGQCTAWCRFFLDILKDLGVKQPLQYVTIDFIGPSPNLPPWDDGFFVHDWNYTEVPTELLINNPTATPYINEGYNYILITYPMGGAQGNKWAENIEANNSYGFSYADMTDNLGSDGQTVVTQSLFLIFIK